MRDLCTMLISWQGFVPEDSSKNKLLCTQVVNTLVKYSADKTKMIFNTNICKAYSVAHGFILEIVGSLLHRWRKLIALNKDTLTSMVGMDDKKEGSNLWKMTGVQILALAVAFDVPLLEKPENVVQLSQDAHCFKLTEPHQVPMGDKLLGALLKIQENKKKQII